MRPVSQLAPRELPSPGGPATNDSPRIIASTQVHYSTIEHLGQLAICHPRNGKDVIFYDVLTM